MAEAFGSRKAHGSESLSRRSLDDLILRRARENNYVTTEPSEATDFKLEGSGLPDISQCPIRRPARFPYMLNSNLPQGLRINLCTEAGDMRRLWEIEEEVIRLAIEHYGGRMSEVSRQLGIGRSTLYRKAADHRIINEARSVE
jgi:DNA-binding NtrC family response regulator